MNYPAINSSDIVFSYVEQWFTGFAPCFQNGIYSLACCKGNRKTGGMRHSVCRRIDSGETVWVLGIAGSDIQKKGHNESGINYSHKDAICLAKIKKALTLKEYSEQFSFRRDAIYSLQDDIIVRIPDGENNHITEECRRTDCATDYYDWDNSRIFCELKQIIMTDEFYIFKAGNKIPDSLSSGHGYSYQDKSSCSPKRADVLNVFLQSSDCLFESVQDPFISTEENSGCGRSSPKLTAQSGYHRC